MSILGTRNGRVRQHLDKERHQRRLHERDIDESVRRAFEPERYCSFCGEPCYDTPPYKAMDVCEECKQGTPRDRVRAGLARWGR